MSGKKNSGMSATEAGRKGDQRTRDERGRAFYEQIGRKGGETTNAERGVAFYEQIGRVGGRRVRDLIEDAKKAGARVSPQAKIDALADALEALLERFEPQVPIDVAARSKALAALRLAGRLP